VGRPFRPEPSNDASTPPLPGTSSNGEDVAAAAGEDAFEDAAGSDGVSEDGSDAARGFERPYATITHAQPPPLQPAAAAASAIAAATSTPTAARTSGGATAQHRPAEFEAALGSFGLRVVFQHNRTGFEESKEFLAPRGTLIAGR
jgi:hypothetical protein